MLPFVLYFLGGALTALHVYMLLSLTVLGAPHNALEFISLLGSLGLLVASYLSLFKPREAAQAALPASLVSWCFYGPAMLATLRSGRHHQIPQLRVALLPYVAFGLLVLVTLYSALASFRTPASVDQPSWFFPSGLGKPGRIAVGAVSLVLMLCIGAWFGFSKQTTIRRASRFVIPEGYVGWVRIEYGVPDASPLPVEEGEHVFRIPADGVLRTSSPELYGWAHDHYYYSSRAGARQLPASGASDRMIWGQVNGESATSGTPRKYEEFFVGSEQQFRDQAGQMKAGGSPTPAPSAGAKSEQTNPSR